MIRKLYHFFPKKNTGILGKMPAKGVCCQSSLILSGLYLLGAGAGGIRPDDFELVAILHAAGQKQDAPLRRGLLYQRKAELFSVRLQPNDLGHYHWRITAWRLTLGSMKIALCSGGYGDNRTSF